MGIELHRRVRTRFILRAASLIVGAGVIMTSAAASAFQVSALPADNLIKNPWFRSAAGGMPGLDDWTPGPTPFGGSQKESNPSPDIWVAPDCNNQQVYCGTAIRWAEQRPACPQTNVGKDATISQVVSVPAGHESDTALRFHTWWVSHRIEIAEVVIAAADSPTGPWTDVWTPFSKSFTYDAAASVSGGAGQDRSQEWVALTATTPLVETTLAKGYAHYRITVHARYLASPTDPCGVGVKFTGMYFSTSATAGTAPPVGPDPDQLADAGVGGGVASGSGDGGASPGADAPPGDGQDEEAGAVNEAGCALTTRAPTQGAAWSLGLGALVALALLGRRRRISNARNE